MPQEIPSRGHEFQATPEAVKIQPIQKMFIANRGEIAARALRACEKRGIKAVLPYSFSEGENVALRMVDSKADEGWELAPISGRTPEETYSNPKKMLEAAWLRGCDAIFLGYGFLAENSDFVRSCEEKGIKVLAPNSRAMETTGNKIKAREIAKHVRLGRFHPSIPVLEGSDNLGNAREAVEIADKLQYPVMLKDPDMGGGMGNVVARNKEELERAFTVLKVRPDNREIFMERYIENAVHVEVQIAADKHGNVVSLGERDCTMQRRSQKVIEESPSPNISGRLRETLEEAAVKFAKAVNYEGVGTWEFIVDRDRKRGREQAWYFMEVNPRIQVEHGVTEEQTGIDIVDTMIDIAEGRPLPFKQSDVKSSGHTIEARVYAENPSANFASSSGTLSVLEYPEIPGIRIDKAYEEGDSVSSWYDTTIAKALAHGQTREQAREMLSRFLSEIRIAGVSSNTQYLHELIDTPQFRRAQGTTTFTERWWAERSRERVHDLKEFVNGGTFIPLEPEYVLDPSLLPQNITVTRRSGDEVSYADSLRQAREASGRNSAAEFGIIERDGIQFVTYYLDSNFRAGTLGIGEALVLRDAARLAHDKNIPLVTICSSGGAEQGQNSVALEMMNTTVANLALRKPPLHINVYKGGVYGGVPASFAGVADIEIAVVSSDTRIGFTGPYPVARSLGKEPKSTRAQDAYDTLGENGTVHSPGRHFQSRNVHLLSEDLADASEKITHMIHLLGIKETVTDPLPNFKPHENLAFREMTSLVTQFDRPGMHFKAWLRRPFTKEFWQPKRGAQDIDRIYENSRLSNAPVAERMRLAQEPSRPTLVDLLDVHSGIFEDATILSNSLHVENDTSYVEQYPPVVGALAKINGEPVMVIGHQTQLEINKDSKQRTKRYAPQKPEDWEYTESLIKLAAKQKLPIILFSDTTGADPTPASEDRNQSHKIARVIEEINKYPYPVMSVGLGIGGSGGAKTFLRPVDAAADFENAVTVVSQPTVMNWIMTGRWVESQEPGGELDQFVAQLRDATAQGRLETGQIDYIIKEGQGGAHVNPAIAAYGLKRWLISTVSNLKSVPQSELLTRRLNRTNSVMERFAIKNQSTN